MHDTIPLASLSLRSVIVVPALSAPGKGAVLAGEPGSFFTCIFIYTDSWATQGSGPLPSRVLALHNIHEPRSWD